MELLILIGLSLPASIMALLLTKCFQNFEKINFVLKKMKRIGLPPSRISYKNKERKAELNLRDFSGGTLGI